MQGMRAKAKTKKATISARVWRAETGKWENLGIIYKTENFLSKIIKKLRQVIHACKI